jgi:HSP20 family protein
MASRFLVPCSTSRNWMSDPRYQLQRAIDRVFEDVFSGSGGVRGSGRSAQTMTAPRIDLQDAQGELRLHADLPGVRPSDLDIRVEGDVLTISGERNEQNFHVMKRSHGRFRRSIQLPFAPNADEVNATVREGVLEIRMPKHAQQERSRRIEVHGADAGGQALASSVAGGSGAGSSAAAGAGSTGQGVPTAACGRDLRGPLSAAHRSGDGARSAPFATDRDNQAHATMSGTAPVRRRASAP